MNQLLKWARQYSAPTLVILALGTAFVFILQNVTEQAISSEFDRRLEEMTLLIERRSRFEEKVLLDKFRKVTELQSELDRVTMTMDRTPPKEPLEKIMDDAVAYHYIIGDKFFDLFTEEREHILLAAGAEDSERLKEISDKIKNLRARFKQLLNEDFGFDSITWETINR